MRYRQDKKAFSLIEMQISLVAAAILILTIGVLSSIGTSTYAGLTKEAEVFNDLSYGFKLMQNRGRSSNISYMCPTGQWTSGIVVVNAGAESFGIFRNMLNNPPTREFSYLNGTTREVILSVPDPRNSPDVLNITAPDTCTDPPSGYLMCGTTNNPVYAINVRISGIKDKVPFSMCSTILRRAQ